VKVGDEVVVVKDVYEAWGDYIEVAVDSVGVIEDISPYGFSNYLVAIEDGNTHCLDRGEIELKGSPEATEALIHYYKQEQSTTSLAIDNNIIYLAKIVKRLEELENKSV